MVVAKEIERKYLINGSIELLGCGFHIKQGYLDIKYVRYDFKSNVIAINDSYFVELDTANPLLYQLFLYKSSCLEIRVRKIKMNYFLTIKDKAKNGIRNEFEYSVSQKIGEYCIKSLCRSLIEKTRHNVNFSGKKWEVDIFEGKLKGLRLAEIELENINESFDKPKWLGEEVTDNILYSNYELAKK